MYNLGLEGLPYELIINSNPSIAYLMRENPMYLQILIMAHCVGHSDFFKNNRMFKNTRPEAIVSKMRNAKKRIQEYTENPNIGLDKVESFLDNLHSIRFQTERNGRKRLTKSQIKKNYIKRVNQQVGIDLNEIDLDMSKQLLEEDRDLLGFLLEYGSHFSDWQRDLINIVKD